MDEYLNAWRSVQKVPNKVYATSLILSGQTIDKNGSERRKAIKILTSRLADRGQDATHVPMNLKNVTKGDVLVLSPSSVSEGVLEAKLPKLQNASVKVGGQVELLYAQHPWIYDNAWKNTFRNHMRNRGFLTSASSYIPLEQIANSNPMKESIRVAAEIIDGQPNLWMNPGTKVMIPLTFDETW